MIWYTTVGNSVYENINGIIILLMIMVVFYIFFNDKKAEEDTESGNVLLAIIILSIIGSFFPTKDEVKEIKRQLIMTPTEIYQESLDADNKKEVDSKTD